MIIFVFPFFPLPGGALVCGACSRRSSDGDAGPVGPAPKFRQLQPVVVPQLSHFRHVPFLTSVKFPQLPHASPS